MPPYHGVSLVLTNTDKGRQLWQEVAISCEWQRVNIVDCVKYNANIVRPTAEPPQRKNIYRDIAQRGYKAVAETTFRPPFYRMKLAADAVKRCRVMWPLLRMWHNLKLIILHKSA